jgi:hypothetical protein
MQALAPGSILAHVIVHCVRKCLRWISCRSGCSFVSSWRGVAKRSAADARGGWRCQGVALISKCPTPNEARKLLPDDHHNSQPHAPLTRAGHQCILSVGGSAMPTLTTISRPSRTDRCGLMMSSVPIRKMSPTYLQMLPTFDNRLLEGHILTSMLQRREWHWKMSRDAG